jgi:hypothetical protein
LLHEAVERADRVAGREQLVCEVRTDEARAACDENSLLHLLSRLVFRSARR